jgi:hypothetical protein
MMTALETVGLAATGGQAASEKGSAFFGSSIAILE